MNTLKNYRWLSILSIFLLVANAITLTLLWTNKKYAGNPFQGPPPHGQAFNYIIKELKFDEHQVEEYKLLRNLHHQHQRPLADSLKLVKDAFYDLLKQPLANDSSIIDLNSKAAALQQQLELEKFYHFQKLRSICTPVQQLKFDAIIDQVIQRMMGPPQHPGSPQNRRGEHGDFPPGIGPDGNAPLHGKEDGSTPPGQGHE